MNDHDDLIVESKSLGLEASVDLGKHLYTAGDYSSCLACGYIMNRSANNKGWPITKTYNCLRYIKQ